MRTSERAAAWAQVLLSSEKPASPEGVAIFDDALTDLPDILSYPGPECQDLIKPFHKVLVRVWIKTVVIGHASWGGWTMVAGSATAGIIPPMKTTTSLQIPDVSVSSALVRHLNTIPQHIPEMDGGELNQIMTYLTLIDMPRHCPGVKPGLHPETRDAYFLCLLAILRALALKKRVVDATLARKRAIIGGISHDLFSFTSLFVLDLIQSPHRVSMALEKGIIDVIFKLPSIYFVLCAERRFENGIVQNLRSILATISRFLVNQTILRGAIRTISTVAREKGLDERLKKNSREVWEAWNIVQTKANGFYAVRREAWTQFCGNPKVSGRQLVQHSLTFCII
ncbi:hypothetical protein PQX77_013616 [Marasmius sp. AFHP31]|nr:hypothetical protein PQX77_013616 [Marasmius sp. AFHP31]